MRYACRTSYAENPATSLQDFDLLTLAEVAALLHCSKAHICNVIAGRVPGMPCYSRRAPRTPEAGTARKPRLVDSA